MKTQKQYLKEEGQFCPFCNSSEVESEGLQADGGNAWAECTCNACGESWTDQYQLTGFNPTESFK